jgi:hypothetical protein
MDEAVQLLDIPEVEEEDGFEEDLGFGWGGTGSGPPAERGSKSSSNIRDDRTSLKESDSQISLLCLIYIFVKLLSS